MRLLPDVTAMLNELQAGVREALGANLLALYLRGSLVTSTLPPRQATSTSSP